MSSYGLTRALLGFELKGVLFNDWAEWLGWMYTKIYPYLLKYIDALPTGFLLTIRKKRYIKGVVYIQDGCYGDFGKAGPSWFKKKSSFYFPCCIFRSILCKQPLNFIHLFILSEIVITSGIYFKPLCYRQCILYKHKELYFELYNITLMSIKHSNGKHARTSWPHFY